MLSKQIVEKPKDAQLHVQRGELYREHADWIAALEDYETAKKLNPELETSLLRGRVLLASGRAADALPVINDFLNRHPHHPQALTYRARALIKMEHFAEAAAGYRKALENTARPEPDLVLEAADSLTSQGASAEALQVMTAGIERIGTIPSLVLRAVDLEVRLKDYDAALVRVDAMRQCAPRPEPWMARRASILAQAGRIEESCKAWMSLAEYLTALPDVELGSHAMSALLKESQQALASLESRSKTTQPPSSP